MKKLLSTFCLISSCFCLFAQTPQLLKDINQGGSAVEEFTQVTEMNGVAYFEADDGVHGLELWRTIGNEPGTYMVLDIDTAYNGCGSEIVAFNDHIYFQGHTDSTGWELWTSDGTAGGTHLLKDIYPGTMSGSPMEFFVSYGKMYFIANDGIHGTELWVTDGTANGTQMVYDIVPGTQGTFQTGLFINSMNGLTYFMGSDFTEGTQLWKTDGTEQGTERVTHLNIGGGGVYFVPDAILNNELYSGIFDSAHGTELWASDGTTGGTHLVKDINPGTGLADVGTVTTYNGKVYFNANDGVHGDELWCSDGTDQGTHMVKDAIAGSDGGYPNNNIVYNGKLYYTYDDGVHGREWWSTDGSEANTAMVADVNPGPGNPGIGSATIYNGRLYFVADNEVDGMQLHQYESTTNIETQISPSPIMPDALMTYLNPLGLFPVLGDLYYPAYYDDSVGMELYHFVTVPLIAGVESATNNGFEVEVYPNPVSSELRIRSAEPIDEIIIADIVGREVYKTEIPNPSLDFKLETTNYPNGVYFVELHLGNKRATQKLIVQH